MPSGGTSAFLDVTLSSHVKEDLDQFKSLISELSSVQEAYHVTGGADYLLRVSTADNSSLEEVINRLTTLSTLARVQTTIVYSQVK